MNLMKQLMVTAIMVSPFAALGGAQKGNLNEADIAKLQGVWQATQFIDSSEKPAPPDEVKELRFEFKAEKTTQYKGKDRPGRPGTYKIDAEKKLKAIDINFGQVSEGIYKFEGDELYLCVVSGARNDKVPPRPTEFKASKDAPYTLIVLKKVTK